LATYVSESEEVLLVVTVANSAVDEAAAELSIAWPGKPGKLGVVKSHQGNEV